MKKKRKQVQVRTLCQRILEQRYDYEHQIRLATGEIRERVKDALDRRDINLEAFVKMLGDQQKILEGQNHLLEYQRARDEDLTKLLKEILAYVRLVNGE